MSKNSQGSLTKEPTKEEDSKTVPSVTQPLASADGSQQRMAV